MMYADIRPHLKKSRERLETINETMVMISLYHMILFSAFTLNLDFKYQVGTSFSLLIVILIVINIAFMIHK